MMEEKHKRIASKDLPSDLSIVTHKNEENGSNKLSEFMSEHKSHVNKSVYTLMNKDLHQ